MKGRYRVVTKLRGMWYIQKPIFKDSQEAQDYIDMNRDIIAVGEEVYIAEEHT